MEEKCENCKFWNKVEEEYRIIPKNVNQGHCRIKHPEIMTWKEIKDWGIFPRTESDEWCGEFKKK